MSRSRVLVIFGGVSSEYEVSLRSAETVIRNIPADEYEVVCVGITKKGRWLFYPGPVEQISDGTWKTHPDCVSAVLSPDRTVGGILKVMPDGMTSALKIDCAFPVLHGKNGEDGTIQGLLALAGIPCVGSGVLASATCMDKEVSHIMLERIGIKMAPWAVVTRQDYNDWENTVERIESALPYPVFVKPANAGSSVGVNRAENAKELKEYIKIAFAHDKKVLVEKAIPGIELECAVLGNDKPKAAAPGRIISCNSFYDYDAKYLTEGSVIQIPAEISPDIAEKVKQTAVRAFLEMGCAGLARVDFFLTGDGQVILNEINTIPGFTSISMYPKMWENEGVSISELVCRLLELSMDS